MATTSELNEILSSETGIPKREIALYARRLRESRLMPQSSGRSFANIDPNHAARLVVALLVADSAGNAQKRLAEFPRLIECLSAILADPEWAGEVESVRVDRTEPRFYIQDRSGKVQPKWEDAASPTSRQIPSSPLMVEASLRGDVFRRISEWINGM